MSITELINSAFSNGMVQRGTEIFALLGFLEGQRIENVVEIGAESGGTFFLWCNIASGKKISVDLPSGLTGSFKYRAPDKTEERANLFRAWAPNVHVITGDSHQAPTLDKVNCVLAGDRVDLLFIDGDHTAAGVQKDFEMYSGLVDGGLVIFHDIKDTEYHRSMGCNVAEFWNSLPGEKFEFCDNAKWGGIGILKVGRQ